MELHIIEAETGTEFLAEITTFGESDLSILKGNWKFDWKGLLEIEEALLFKLTLKNQSSSAEGLLMLTLVNEEALFMNNVEVAPHNYGSKGKYENVAGALISYACEKSFESGKGDYVGFLSFQSKSSLVSLYQEKYGATLAIGRRMYIEPGQAKRLMEKYLGKKL